MKRLHGYCAVIALTYVSGLPESQVVDMCRWHHFVDNGKGMDDDDWLSAAKDLGIRLRRLHKKHDTIRDFLQAHPTGLFLVGTRNHLFAVLNGGMVNHPNQRTTDKRCKIDTVWRVLT